MKKVNLLIIFLYLFFCSCKPSVQEENKVTIRVSRDPESLNPASFSNTVSLEIINLIYQGLYYTDPDKFTIRPLLVETVPVVTKSDSSAVFSFRIRPEANWEPNKPITGEDIAFSLKLFRCPLVNNQQLSGRYDFIRDVKVDPNDKKKFQIICDPYMPEMDLMTGDYAVLPAYIVDPQSLLRKFSLSELTRNYDALANDPQIKAFAEWFNSERFTRDKNFLKGSGGYELAEWKTGEVVRLQKKQNWWADEVGAAINYITAHPDEIVYQIIPDNATAVLSLKSNNLDVLGDIPANQYKQLAADKSFTKQYSLFTPETYDFTYLGLNARLGKFADARTRQALAHLLETDKIIKATVSGFGTRTVGPIAPSNNQFYNKELKPYDYNLNQATALLQAAGWIKNENGWQKNINGEAVPLTININYKAGNTEFENIALIFQQAAAKLNIPVTVQPLEGKLLTKNLKAHNFEMFIRSLSGNPFVYNFKPILHTESAAEGGGNYTAFGTSESDQLIDQINETQNPQDKARLLKQLQQILHEQSNLIFLYFSTDRLAINKRFTNVKVSGIKPGYDVSAFELKTD